MNEKDIITLQKLIDNAKNIVFFGGAGVSTESGIRDFRSEDGLYALKSKYGSPYEVMLSHSFYKKNPDLFYAFYREFMIDTKAKPNDAHKFLAELEKKKNLTIVTQNIDGLHQKAGSKTVYELHGSVLRNYCEYCHAFYDEKIIEESANAPDKLPHCTKEDCNGLIKPDVVLYEEGLDNDTINNSIMAIKNADTLIIGGTSLTVYPAAGLVDYFHGENLVMINKTSTMQDSNATLVIHGKIAEVLGQIKVN